MEKYEDALLRKIFAVALTPAQADPAATPPVVLLDDLAGELRDEAGAGGGCDAPILLNKDNADRALMTRLGARHEGAPQWPVHYLLGCYARADEEARAAGLLKDPADRQRAVEAATLARQLAVSYVGLIFEVGMFPEPSLAQERGPLQLLDALYAAADAGGGGLGVGAPPPGAQPSIPAPVSGATAVEPMPPGFLEDFGARFAQDDLLVKVVSVVVRGLMVRLSSASVLGDYAAPLAVLERLAASRPLAAVLVRLPFWLPAAGAEGRAVEFQTVLGAAFGVSALPDMAAWQRPSARLPDVADQVFGAGPDMRGADLRAGFASVHASLGQLHTQLHRLLMALLKNAETREAALDWLAAAVSTNAERAKMRPDVKRAATDGFMLNVAAVALRLCEPFVDPAAGKAWGKLDARYASDPDARAHAFAEDTRLGATSEQVAAWVSSGAAGEGQGGGSASKGKYHFVCEIFFIASLALRLALKPALDSLRNTSSNAAHYQEYADAAAQGAGAAALEAPMLRRLVARLRAVAVAYEATLQLESLLAGAVQYHRLMAAFLLRLACPACAAGGPPVLPLPEPVPMEFASLPEYLVEDLCEALLWVGRARPDLLTAQRGMEQYMLFFTVFLGSPAHVKNPYLRGRLVEALHSNMPTPEEEEDGARGRPSLRRRHAGGRGQDEVATLFEVHPLVVAHMVRSLITLYVDIERTDRHNAFYEKFHTRYQIGEVLAYLWKLPQHRLAWRTTASTARHLYVRFVNMMINDSQHLLQEALEALPAIQETERLQADAAAWAALAPEERRDREAAQADTRRRLRGDFSLAAIYLRMMQYTSEDAAVAARFFDVQVRDRQARILNFFLRYLTLPEERRRLKLRDPQRYGWAPKDLIASLAAIHVNLYRANRTAWAAAVAADTDYYGPAPQIFTELAAVLRALGLAPAADIADLEALAADAARGAAGAAAEEEAFDDVPEGFEDPLSCRLMTDPVRLPSGNVLDRGTILQHLLTDQRDPFSRAAMSEADLEPLPELRQRIAAWTAEQRAKRAAAGASAAGGTAAGMQVD